VWVCLFQNFVERYIGTHYDFVRLAPETVADVRSNGTIGERHSSWREAMRTRLNQNRTPNDLLRLLNWLLDFQETLGERQHFCWLRTTSNW
jgi:hypothetical protein